MRVLLGVALTLTAIILAYTIRKPALRYAFYRDQPETPHGWTPKMREYKNGVLQ